MFVRPKLGNYEMKVVFIRIYKLGLLSPLLQLKPT